MEPRTIKVVVNVCYGGFSLSKKAILRMRELGSAWAKRVLFPGDKHPWQNHTAESYNKSFSMAAKEGESWWEDADRTDPILVQAVEELGEEANGECSDLEVQICTWHIEIKDYDGMESVSSCFY